MGADMDSRTRGVLVLVAVLALPLVVVPLLLGAVRVVWWSRLGTGGELQYKSIRGVMNSRPAVAAEALLRGDPGNAWSYLRTGGYLPRGQGRPNRGSSNRGVGSDAGDAGDALQEADIAGADELEALGWLRRIEAGQVPGAEQCSPLARDYRRVLGRIHQRETGQRTKGFLGLSLAYERGRAVGLGRKLAGCIAGADMTGFGGQEAADIGIGLINLGIAASGGGGGGSSSSDDGEAGSRQQEAADMMNR